ncbi:hypothetical protein [Streptomyces sp. NPDC086023]|uniref:hypothetical protein n=1 Tax=Streptomyces sp. NPDC086023 TaxID=3365746 RepID=UPI0037D16F09
MRTSKGTTRRAVGTAAAGTVLAALALAAPAHAAAGQATGHQATARAAGGTTGTLTGTGCTPSIRVLASLPGPGEDPRPWMATTEVRGIGPLGLSVGRSQNRPAYWTGTAVHAVPLPSGYTSGVVEAVNRWGLMVGSVSGPGLAPLAFRYFPGAPAVGILPGGTHATDVNDWGRAVGHRRTASGMTGLEWSGGSLRRELPLPPHITRLEGVGGINNAGQIVGDGFGLIGDEGYFAGLRWAADPATPPAELPDVHPGDTYSTYEPRDIDESGRIAGTYGFTHTLLTNGAHWLPPYTAVTHAPGLGDRTQSTFEDISPTTNVSVGTASDSTIVGPWPPETAPPHQATYWKGSGPLLGLPRLAATPTAHAGAFTVTDHDQVGGFAVDAADVMHPVIWTCASKQATLPPSGS